MLTRFGKRPAAFILGAILSTLLDGVTTMVAAILDAVRFLFVGESPNTTEGTLGLADIPLFAAETLIEAGDKTGGSLLDVLETFMTALVETALSFGPLSPIALAAEISVVLVIVYYVGRTSLRVALDVVPGLGGLMK